MRGALYYSVTVGVNVGIIPADAGSTFRQWSGPGWHEDHPRGCGEHLAQVAASP